jgi:nitroreductase
MNLRKSYYLLSTLLLLGAAFLALSPSFVQPDFILPKRVDSLFVIYETETAHRVNQQADTLPLAAPPTVREHRLYQADWLMRFYGFTHDEIVPPSQVGMLALDMEAASQKLGGVPIGAFMDDSVLQLLNLSARQHQAVLCYACGHPL